MAARRDGGYTEAIDRPAPTLLLRLAIVAAASCDGARRVDGLVDGDHYWRQAHVVANVDKMLANGVFATPSAWNHDLFLHFYDLPVFQALVTVLVRLTGAVPAAVAEWCNVAALAVLLLATWRIGERLALPPRATTLALALLALAPLGRFWFSAPTIDPFVVTISVVSFAAYFELRTADATARRRRGFATALWLGAAFVATASKSPVQLPVALTVVAIELREGGLAALWRPRVVAFGVTSLAALGLFFTLSARANATAIGWPDRATELAWYFGSGAERLSLAPHTTIVARIAKQVLSIPIALVALVGAFAARRWPLPPRARDTVLVFCLAAVLTSLLFLHVNVVHGYYQLPCLVPLALLGGTTTDLALRWLGARAGRWPLIVTGSALALLLAAALWSSERYLARLTAPSTATFRTAGAFVQAHTTGRDFVLYARPEPDDNPVCLYYAQRDGANVHGALDPARLAATWRPHAAARGRRLVLFVPADVEGLPGATTLAAAAPGRLLVLHE